MKRVLIVDDAAFMRLALKSIVQDMGFEVAGEAENGEIAVKKYKELKPDIVTMDITMPEMTGIEAVKEIIKFDASAKIVMVSSMGQESIVRQAIISGAKSFILKPLKNDHVTQTLQKIAGL